jgi:hypothetical protein
MFRITTLLNVCPNHEIGYDRARIFDYFFSFPHRAANLIHFIKGSGFSKAQFKTTNNKYQTTQDDRQLFFEMSRVFEGAARCLAAYGEINIDSLKIGMLDLKHNSLISNSSELLPSMDPVRERILELFSGPFLSIPMTGANGLKASRPLKKSIFPVFTPKTCSPQQLA